MTIKVLELFAGIGAFSKALERLGIDHEIVDAVEIDKYAIKSFNAIHGTNFEPQDIAKWSKDIKVDVIMHGSPCQDFSVAGKQAGGDEGSGTRSSLLYESLRIIEQTRPEIVIWENVKNLIGKKHRHNWQAYVDKMTELGYESQAKVLNAKDFGIPQNRERVFTISIKKDSKLVKSFQFPESFKLEKKLKDMLEENPDERFFLSDKQVASFQASTKKQQDKGNGFKFEPFEREGARVAHCIATTAGSRQTDNFIKMVGKVEAISGHDILKRVYSPDGASPTISTMQGGNREPKVAIKTNTPTREPQSGQTLVVASRGRGENNEQHLEPRKDGLTNTITSVQKDNYVAIRTANKQGYDFAADGDGIDLAYPQSSTPRGRVGHGVAKTIPTSGSQGTLDGFRIRKLTPKECWRLMGFDDKDFDKAQTSGMSNTQLYKQAGNSIVVNVLEAIIKGIKLKEEE